MNGKILRYYFTDNLEQAFGLCVHHLYGRHELLVIKFKETAEAFSFTSTIACAILSDFFPIVDSTKSRLCS